MGQLVNGEWITQDVLTDQQGEFHRTPSAFIGKLPSLPVQLNRFLLIASRACPWAHRVIIAIKLLKIDNLQIEYSPPLLGAEGWLLPETAQSRLQMTWVHELYKHSHPNYTGRVTLPLFVDQNTNAILSNDSTELLLALSQTWREQGVLGTTDNTRLPLLNHAELADVQEWQRWITSKISNGPYRAIFTEHQPQYEANVLQFFGSLDLVEERLKTRTFFMGEQMTLCDLCLFPTLCRFHAYGSYLKCRLKTLSEYPELSRYTSLLMSIPEISETVSLEEINLHYHRSVPKQPHVTLLPRVVNRSIT